MSQSEVICITAYGKFFTGVTPNNGEPIDLWTFRDLDFLRVVLLRPMIGPFATWYFSHLFDPSRFATSVIFAVCCQLTVNCSLKIMQSVIFTDFDYKSVLFQDIQSYF